jgi:hypothetical protein
MNYTYQNWFEGDTYLDTCPTVSDPGINIGIKTVLSEYDLKDQKSIIRKQKSNFYKMCNNLKKTYIKEFKKRYSNSEVKGVFMKNEILDLKSLLFLNSQNDLSFKNRDFEIKRDDLFIMRDFSKKFILKGIKYYDFMHSVNYKYQPKTYRQHEIYIYANWLYYNWLKEFSLEIEKKIPVKVIALINLYNGIKINRENANAIAAKYGYTSKSSGEGLFQDYTMYLVMKRRIGSEGVKRKNITKLKHISQAIKKLDGQAKKKAKNDYEILKKITDAME